MALGARPSEGGSVSVEDECFELLAVVLPLSDGGLEVCSLSIAPQRRPACSASPRSAAMTASLAAGTALRLSRIRCSDPQWANGRGPPIPLPGCGRARYFSSACRTTALSLSRIAVASARQGKVFGRSGSGSGRRGLANSTFSLLSSLAEVGEMDLGVREPARAGGRPEDVG
jgi:hypothetical protein